MIHLFKHTLALQADHGRQIDLKFGILLGILYDKFHLYSPFGPTAPSGPGKPVAPGAPLELKIFFIFHKISMKVFITDLLVDLEDLLKAKIVILSYLKCDIKQTYQ